MKKIFSILFMVLLASQLTFAQTFEPRSGDADLDKELKERNQKMKANMETFFQTMKEDFNAEKEKVKALMEKYVLEPADAYIAYKIAKVSGRNVDEVGTSYAKNKGKGWGATAKEMGIKPGSPEFHQLKAAGKDKDKSKDKESKGNSGKGKKSNGGSKEKGNNSKSKKL